MSNFNVTKKLKEQGVDIVDGGAHYTKLPTGMLIQEVKNISVGGKSVVVNLPIAFANTDYTATCSFFTSGNYSEYCSTHTYETGSLRVFNSNGVTLPVNVIAVGRWK